MRRHCQQLAILGAAAVAVPCSALTWSAPNPYLLRLEASTQELSLHPFRPGLGLTNSLGSSAEQVTAALRAEIRHPFLGIKSVPGLGGFALNTGTQTLEYSFHVNGVPICRTYARAHIAADGGSLVLGRLPRIDASESLPATHASDWPDLDLAIATIKASLDEDGEVTVKSSKRCFVARHGQLLHAYDFILTVNGLPWTALADGYEVFSREPAYFDVTGTARVHPNNILNDKPTDVKLTDLVGDGTLTSDVIKTLVPNGFPAVNDPSHKYVYEPGEDPRYDEVAAFYYAQRHHQFLKDLGFEWYGPKPLVIRLHVKPAGRSNNALFIPAINPDELPSISIDDGDGVELQHLATDADVISHEFGHHVVYKTIRSTEGESLVLHEGLADFFAFARSGDPCLGESICPQGTGACVVEAPTACLRSAAIDLVYKSSVWDHWAGGSRNRLGHLHGQLVSGLLWDLRSSKAIPAEELTKLVLKAVSYFKSDSGLRDLMLALFFADRDLFNSKYFRAIYAAGQARGLGDLYDDVEPTGSSIPDIAGGGLQAGDSPAIVEKTAASGRDQVTVRLPAGSSKATFRPMRPQFL